jgi:hypothetical protein
MKNIYKFLTGKPVRKKAFGYPSRRWKDNIKADFKENRCEGVNWISICVCGQEPAAGCSGLQ